jgi:hypothetical protein
MATGLARGAKARGKRIAFGDGRRIIWDHNSELIFRGNPNIAAPGCEAHGDIEWVPYYKGHRIYNHHDKRGNRWVWNLDFRPTPGEVFLSMEELRDGNRAGSGFVLIEPNVEGWKSVAPNKDWGRARYQAVADRLIADGLRVVQFAYEKAGPALKGAEVLRTTSFRDALAVMRHAAIYIGPEGGLHHGAAAMGRNAVVLFGGFIPASVTGYEGHANMTGGAEACGSILPCAHCRAALDAITVGEVYAAAKERL